ncbi:MAG: transglutaminase family protein [Thermoplasmatota archaeon]
MRKAVPAVLLAVVLLAGCTSWPFEDTTREGFRPGDLVTPDVSSYERLQSTPQEQLPHRPDFVTPSLSITVAPLYARYGGTVKVTVPNGGSNDLFVYNAALDIGDDTWRWTDGSEGIEIPAGGSRDIYVAAGDGLSQPGLYDFSLELSFMVNNRAGTMPYPSYHWYDLGTRTYSSFSNLSGLQIRPYNSSSNPKVSYNYYRDFDRVNDLVDPSQFQILTKAREVAGPYGSPGEYNIAMVCAVFDFLQNNHSYVDDPDNVWQRPATTLQRGGDCEDYAMLFSALVSSLGGTTRVYVTDTHAFPGVYIGGTAMEARHVVEGIHAYYGTDFYVATLEDDLGYWLVADCLTSGFYLGNLPVGGAPVGQPLQDPFYNWDFGGTNALKAIDVMPD